MRLRTKYILFVAILHGLALLLSYCVFRENMVFFIVSEAVILISVGISWQLYRELIQPLKMLAEGAEAIKDRDFNVKFILTGKYEMDELIRIYNKMMDELRMERTKQEEQHLFLEKLIYTSPTGILILDYDGCIQQVNPKALELLGCTEKELAGKDIDALPNPILRQVMQLESGHARTFTLNGAVTYKLQKSHFIDRGFARHFIMIEELTAEILAAEKKTYGNVIRMMAHEVNNTIGPVNSILQFTLQAQEHSEMLTNALKVAMERNQSLNGFMRNFADLVRIPVPEKRPVDIMLLVRKTIDLWQLRAIEKEVVFELEVGAPGAVMVNADVQLMEQVLINIIKNAIEAIDRKGTITIISHSFPAQLIIRDTGKGIPPELEEYLFSPFYSTKKDGQGIGLMLVREILTSHGFEFSLKTVADRRTEFRVLF